MSAAIDPQKNLADEIGRVLAGEIDKAIAELSDPDMARGAAIHETRKRFKKVRGVLRLVRSAAPDFYARENTRYRDLARTMAGGRDASALVETVDRMSLDYPKETRAGELDPVRAVLAAARDKALEDDADLDEAIATAIESCREGRAALADLSLPTNKDGAVRLLAKGAAATVRAARKALRRASENGSPDDFHELRKAVKRHSIQLGVIGSLWPEPASRRRRAMKDLGESLGELNDIAVLGRVLDGGIPDRRSSGKGADQQVERSVALLWTLLHRREIRLRKQCLAASARLFPVDPKTLEGAIESSWAADSRLELQPAPATMLAASG